MKGKCRYYKKEGHWKAKCLKLKDKRDKADNTSYGGDTTNIATDNFDGTKYILTISSSSFGDAWVLDSGCSYPMCPDKDWFVNYQFINGGTVLMGNNMSYKVVGIRTV